LASELRVASGGAGCSARGQTDFGRWRIASAPAEHRHTPPQRL